ncbi:hypothetical protein MHI32_11935 [Paenibacillus sp. FSL H7-0690]|uniref:hypothetical protein n=1 Tax=Paenibacillus sp. FSL H7-0690 TaxID=2921437 RepID=UPI0030EDE675
MDVLIDKLVKTRKFHRCFGCNETIPEKTDGIRFTKLANEGRVYSTYTCARCEEWIKNNHGYFEDGEYYRGDIKEAMVESGEWKSVEVGEEAQ